MIIFGCGVVGCTIPFPSPRDVSHIRLEILDSPKVIIRKIWLERKEGQLFVTGYVWKKRGVGDTTDTHLDAILYDQTDQIILQTVEHFDPRQIPNRRRRTGYSTFRIGLDPLPAETTQIEVRAHEGTEATCVQRLPFTTSLRPDQ